MLAILILVSGQSAPDFLLWFLLTESMRPGIPSTLRRAAFLCLVVALLWPSRVAADGSDEQQHSRLEAKVDQLSAQLSRLESLVTAIHAAVTVPGAAPAAASTEQPQPQPAPPAAVPGQVNSPYAKLAAAVGAQWLWDQAHCTESTIHFVFGLWDDSADMPEDFQGQYQPGHSIATAKGEIFCYRDLNIGCRRKQREKNNRMPWDGSRRASLQALYHMLSVTRPGIVVTIFFSLWVPHLSAILTLRPVCRNPPSR